MSLRSIVVKKSFWGFLPGLACLFFCPPLFAANPLVNLPQGDFACTVEVTPHNVPKPDPASPERQYSPVLNKIAITQIGKIRRNINKWSDNSVSQLWSLTDKGVSLLESNGAGKNVFLLRGELRDRACPQLLNFDAGSVSWITEKSLVKDGAGAMLHYRATIKLPISEEGQRDTVIYQAWIDSKTLLPLKFDDGDALYTLKFSPTPPVGPLVIPPNIRAELDRWKKALAPRPHL